MFEIKKYDSFIFEKFGSNDICKELSNIILDIINQNIGKLILNKSIFIKSPLLNFKEIEFINDELNVKLSNRTYGNINPKSIVIDGDLIDGVIINLEMELNPTEIESKRIDVGNKIFKTIRHEFLHIVEIYLTKKNIKNTEKSLAISWEMGERLQNLQKKYKKSENWQDVSHLIYLSLPHEMRSKIEEINAEIESSGIKGILKTQDFIKKTKAYKDVEFISNVDIGGILNKLKKDKNYNKIIKDVSEYFLQSLSKNHERQFIDYFNRVKIKNRKLLTKLLKSSYNFESNGYFDKEIDYSEYIAWSRDYKIDKLINIKF